MNEIKSKGMAGEIPVFCSFDKIVPLEDMKPNPKNPNKHPQGQIDILVRIIQAQGWRQPVKVSTRSGFIVSGHGRYEAAKQLGCPVPVDYQDYATESDELSDLLADNRIAELAEIDKRELASLFGNIDADSINASLSGYSSAEVDRLIQEVSNSISDEDLDSFFEEKEAEEPEERGKVAHLVTCPKCGEKFEV